MEEQVGLNNRKEEVKINMNDQSSKGKGKHYKSSESAFSRKREDKQAHGLLSHERKAQSPYRRA